MKHNKKNRSYYTSERPEIIERLPKKINSLLDVGCGSGAFAAKIKDMYSCIGWGVEIDEKEAAFAKNKLDTVLVGKIEEVIDKIPNNKFDVISFNDVLEHLEDPYTIIHQIKPKFKKSGKLVASIPNVRYIRNLYRLIFLKDWQYEDEGILDNTHLRFFTKKSIINMFEENGYEVVSIEGINQLAGFKKYLIIWLSLGWLLDTTYVQYLVIAKLKK
jgi:2-polyprenyl-3-methyl-5-hydroxy-6-metoxy-1,4-benzoquinol methylase